MPVNYMDTTEGPGFLGAFIGQVNLPFWSTPEEEGRNNPNGPPDYKDADKFKLYWNVQVLDITQEWDGEDVKSVNKSFGIGKQPWAPMASAPNNIRHEDDPGDAAVEAGEAKPILFNEKSGLGMLLALISGKFDEWHTDDADAEIMDGLGPVRYDLTSLGKYFRDNEIYDSRDADIWKGLIFEFRGLGLKYGTNKVRMTPLPVRWLPEFSGAADLSKLSGARDGGSAPDTAVWESAGADAATAATLASLVTRSPNHAAFAKNAALLPAVKDNETLMAAVMDETNGNWGA